MPPEGGGTEVGRTGVVEVRGSSQVGSGKGPTSTCQVLRTPQGREEESIDDVGTHSVRPRPLEVRRHGRPPWEDVGPE